MKSIVAFALLVVCVAYVSAVVEPDNCGVTFPRAFGLETTYRHGVECPENQWYHRGCGHAYGYGGYGYGHGHAYGRHCNCGTCNTCVARLSNGCGYGLGYY